jgi:Domain of unknown function (DUF1707)
MPAPQDEVFEALKAAFVEGRLTMDEFVSRVSAAHEAYARLDALTRDIPAPVPRPAPVPAAALAEQTRAAHNRKLVAQGSAVGGAAVMVAAAALVLAISGNVFLGLVAGTLTGGITAILLSGLLTLLSVALDRPARVSRPRLIR